MYIKIELLWDVFQVVPYLGHSATNNRVIYFSHFICTITTADKSRLSTECPVYSAIWEQWRGSVGVRERFESSGEGAGVPESVK